MSKLVTNGEVIVTYPDNLEALETAATKLTEALEVPFEIEGPMEDGDFKDYHIIRVPEGVILTQLTDRLPSLEVKSIGGSEEFQDEVPYMREVFVRFSEEETKQQADEMSGIIRNISDVEAEKKAANSSFKDRLDTLQARLQSVNMDYIRKGTEKHLKVFKRLDFANGFTKWVTEDGEIVETTVMSAEDRQLRLNLVTPKAESESETESQQPEIGEVVATEADIDSVIDMLGTVPTDKPKTKKGK